MLHRKSSFLHNVTTTTPTPTTSTRLQQQQRKMTCNRMMSKTYVMHAWVETKIKISTNWTYLKHHFYWLRTPVAILYQTKKPWQNSLVKHFLEGCPTFFELFQENVWPVAKHKKCWFGFSTVGAIPRMTRSPPRPTDDATMADIGTQTDFDSFQIKLQHLQNDST